MDKVHALLQTVMHYQIFSIQVWVYLVLMVAPFVLNEIVSRTNSIVAKTLFQFAMRALLQIPAVGVALSAIPGLGTALHKMANDVMGLPPTFAQRRAARKARKAAVPKAEEKPAEAPKPEESK